VQNRPTAPPPEHNHHVYNRPTVLPPDLNNHHVYNGPTTLPPGHNNHHVYNRPNPPPQGAPDIIYLKPGYVAPIKPEYDRPHVGAVTPINRPSTESQPPEVIQRPTVRPILPSSQVSAPSNNRGTTW
jgi:hypothetical protein